MLRIIARFAIYVGGLLSGFCAMYEGVQGFLFGGEMDERKLLAYVVIGIALMFLGTEISERMR